MQKFILSFILLIASITFINAQSKFTVGLGASGNLFVQSTADPYFISHNSISPHLHFKYEPFSFARFSGQIQANFYSKEIGLSRSYESNQGGTVVEAFYYQHFATDLVFSVAYNRSISKKLSQRPRLLLRPRLGFFFSFNHFFDTEETYGVSGGSGGTTNVTRVELPESSSYFYPGVMTGIELERLKNRSFSLFADVYITPRDIFQNPLVYEIDGQSNEIQGKFHYLNVGIRYGLDKF